MLYSAKTAPAALLVAILAAGCFPNIHPIAPVEGEAIDADPISFLADVPGAFGFGTPAGTVIVPTSFAATLIPVGQAPVDVTADYTATATGASGTTSGVAIGRYRLNGSIANNANLPAQTGVNFTVEYSGPDFLGGFNDFTVSGVNDGCFLGLLGGLIPVGTPVGTALIPSFNDVDQNGPLNVVLPAPPPLGAFPVQVDIASNAIVVLPAAIPPVDLGPATGGIVNCTVSATVQGSLLRTGPNTADPRATLSGITLSNSSIGVCTLPAPNPACTITIDLEGV